MRLVSYSCCLPSTFCSCSVYILSCAPSHQSKARGDELYARTLENCASIQTPERGVSTPGIPSLTDDDVSPR